MRGWWRVRFRALWGAQQLEAGPGKGVRKEESAVG